MKKRYREQEKKNKEIKKILQKSPRTEEEEKKKKYTILEEFCTILDETYTFWGKVFNYMR